MRSVWAVFALLIVGGSGFAQPSATFQVEGRHLYDPCGERVVLRGVNAMILYWDRLGETTYPEIAKTGANAVRIFWHAESDATPEQLDQTLANCWANNMIPIICVWDATGKWEAFEKCVAFWESEEIAAVINKHEGHVLVNIANEAGDGSVSQETYREAYIDAVQRLREAGYRMPLIIDAGNWGRDEDYLFENAAALLEADPLDNLIFSWHPWDTEQPDSRYISAFDRAGEMGICMIVGEFSHIGVFYEKPIPYELIIEECQARDIGWLAWVWWCCRDDYDGHTISADKTYGNWANDPWGENLIVESAYGIEATAERTAYLKTGECASSVAPNVAPADH